jgi:hypothetical protein
MQKVIRKMPFFHRKPRESQKNVIIASTPVKKEVCVEIENYLLVITCNRIPLPTVFSVTYIFIIFVRKK